MQATEETPRAGKGFLVAGAVLMVLAVLGVGAVVAVFGSRLDLDEFARDVAINGDLESGVPGQLGFRIIESLSSDDDTMTVGVALSTTSPDVDCVIVDVRGEEVAQRRGSAGDTFVSPDIDGSWTVSVVAEDLAPGEYSARCEVSGEPSAAAGDRFTVGRILASSEVFGLFGPLLAIGGAVVIGGVLGLIGLVLLIVGLVRRSRSGRRDASPPGWPPGGPPRREQEHGQGAWDGAQWQGGPASGAPPAWQPPATPPTAPTQPPEAPTAPPEPADVPPTAPPPTSPPPTAPPPTTAPPGAQPSPWRPPGEGENRFGSVRERVGAVLP